MTIEVRNTNDNLPVRVLRPPTGGVWSNVGDADLWKRSIAPPTCPGSPTMLVLDLNGVQPTVGVLEPVLRELAQDIKAGRFGESVIVVSTQDPALRRYVELIAAAENLPLYVSASTTAFSLINATPAAPLSRTDSETLDAIMNLRGSATAAEVAAKLHLQPTAAINRLNVLAEKGLLHKRRQAGRKGDRYVDYRSAALAYSSTVLNTTIRDLTEPILDARQLQADMEAEQ